MNAFLSRRIQVLVLALVSLCFVDIAWFTLSWAWDFKALYGKDEVSRLTNRLLFQLWPLALFTGLLWLRTPEEFASAQ